MIELKPAPQTPVMSNKKRGLSEVTNTVRKTPPLCTCGRRSKFQIVSKPGPNLGRSFYACPKGAREGCSFFKWESLDLGQSPAFKPPKKMIRK